MASSMMKPAFNEPNCEAVKVVSPIERSTTRSAYRVIDPADCSNSAQKTMVERIRIIRTTVRPNSGE